MGDQDSESGFDFEAIDGDSDQLSVLVTATPSSSVAGEEDPNASSGALLPADKVDEIDERALQTAHSSFSSLRPRFITVLSDFGETEKFVLEGDSLLMNAFSDERLDWSHGGQFLHLVYLVEKLLSELLSRGAHLCIPFFDSHASIWTDPSKRVARSLLIHHLKQTLPSNIPVVCFESPASEEWVDFLAAFQPALVAVSDVLPQDAASPFPLRSFAVSSLTAGIHLLLLRDIEILDHSVQGFYISAARQISSFSSAFSSCAPTSTPPAAAAGAVAAFLEEAPAQEAASILQQRAWHVLAVSWACSAALRDKGCDASTVTGAKLLIIHAVVLARGALPLLARAQALSSAPPPTATLWAA
eukprot:CAMPEP_0181307918 /NCGR_PEP_ID=MMETSP1101-20121128/11157_1 /TAXON_ID=46948 /ORGANISM="Rhodomonas abbreviata, Strain Caron Lab Isolate" /LENGTH=357 /DNA_ID=CAMNT_0023414209 /DNA_START=403 /DNA_END=1472 /DNA_ORIENTATION=-